MHSMNTAGITRGGDALVCRGRLLLTAADVRVGELDSLTELKEGEGRRALCTFSRC
jgi:hypothetical protein